MEIVKVIGAPRASFNKHRRISDLVRTQVQHFKHLAHTMGPEAHEEIPHHAVMTEHDAAVFIHAMTGLVRRPKGKTVPIRKAKAAKKEIVFAIAAVEEEKKPRRRKAKSKAKSGRKTQAKKTAAKRKAEKPAEKSAVKKPATKKKAAVKKTSAKKATAKKPGAKKKATGKRSKR